MTPSDLTFYIDENRKLRNAWTGLHENFRFYNLAGFRSGARWPGQDWVQWRRAGRGPRGCSGQWESMETRSARTWSACGMPRSV